MYLSYLEQSLPARKMYLDITVAKVKHGVGSIMLRVSLTSLTNPLVTQSANESRLFLLLSNFVKEQV